MGCSDLHLIAINPQTSEMKQNFPLNAREAVEEFSEVVEICEPVKFAASNPGWSVIKDQDFISEDEIRRSEFYDWASQYNATYRLGLRLLTEPVWLVSEVSGADQPPTDSVTLGSDPGPTRQLVPDATAWTAIGAERAVSGSVAEASISPDTAVC